MQSVDKHSLAVAMDRERALLATMAGGEHGRTSFRKRSTSRRRRRRVRVVVSVDVRVRRRRRTTTTFRRRRRSS